MPNPGLRSPRRRPEADPDPRLQRRRLRPEKLRQSSLVGCPSASLRGAARDATRKPAVLRAWASPRCERLERAGGGGMFTAGAESLLHQARCPRLCFGGPGGGSQSGAGRGDVEEPVLTRFRGAGDGEATPARPGESGAGPRSSWRLSRVLKDGWK